MKDAACWPVDDFAREECLTFSPQSRRGLDAQHAVQRQAGRSRSAGRELRHTRVGAVTPQAHLKARGAVSQPATCTLCLQRHALRPVRRPATVVGPGLAFSLQVIKR